MQPQSVMVCNLDLESLITDVNRSIATLAITTLLKVKLNAFTIISILAGRAERPSIVKLKPKHMSENGHAHSLPYNEWLLIFMKS